MQDEEDIPQYSCESVTGFASWGSSGAPGPTAGGPGKDSRVSPVFAFRWWSKPGEQSECVWMVVSQVLRTQLRPRWENTGGTTRATARPAAVTGRAPNTRGAHLASVSSRGLQGPPQNVTGASVVRVPGHACRVVWSRGSPTGPAWAAALHRPDAVAVGGGACSALWLHVCWAQCPLARAQLGTTPGVRCGARRAGGEPQGVSSGGGGEVWGTHRPWMAHRGTGDSEAQRWHCDPWIGLRLQWGVGGWDSARGSGVLETLGSGPKPGKRVRAEPTSSRCRHLVPPLSA